MSTIRELARALGVVDKTVQNRIKDGYTLIFLASGKINVEESVRSYVKYQSEKIRHMKANKGREVSGNSRIRRNIKPPESFDDWKTEKEKQAAIKLQLQNGKDRGELIPVDAMIELYNAPLSAVKNKLLDLSNQIQKRVSLKPDEVKQVDDVVRAALERLNGKGLDELHPIIEEILERYSKFYRSTDEGADHPMGEDE